MTETTLQGIHPRYLISRIGDSNAVLNDIPDTGDGSEFSIAGGYPAIYAKPFDEGGKPLNRSEMNNVFNLLTQLHFYWQMGGVPIWDSRLANSTGAYSGIGGYPKQAHVYKMVEDELVEFMSLVDNNSETPSKTASTWKVVTMGADAVTEEQLNAAIAGLSSTCKTTDDILGASITRVQGELIARDEEIISSIIALSGSLSGVISGLTKGCRVINVTSDQTSVADILAETGHSSDVFTQGDTLIVTNSNTIKSAYCYDGADWDACTGNVDASKVLLTTSIDLAGNYTSIGNITKSSVSEVVTDKFPVKTSIQQIVSEMFDKIIAPTVSSTPSNSISLRNGSAGAYAGEFEVGTKFTPYYSVSFTDGVFTCSGKNTNAGCTASSYDISDSQGTTATESSGTIYSEFTVGDGSKDDSGTVVGISEYHVTAKTAYGKSNYAKNNKGVETTVCIDAGETAEASSGKVKGVRYMFWGMDAGTGDVDSATVRGLLHSEKPSSGKTLPTVSANEIANPKRCIIAILNTSSLNKTKVTMPSAMGADVTGTFVKQSGTVSVEGLNGYPAAEYKIWVYKPDVLDTTEKYDITIG